METLDNGTFMPLAFDVNGNFHFITSLSLDGSRDGSHNVQFRATDGAGRTSDPVTFPFTLDTRPPGVTITAPTGLAQLPDGRILVTDDYHNVIEAMTR